MDYWINRQNVTYGPYSDATLKVWMTQGYIDDQVMVCVVGDTKWVKAIQMLAPSDQTNTIKITLSKTLQMRCHLDFDNPDYDGNIEAWMCKKDLLEALILYCDHDLVACKWKINGEVHVDAINAISPEFDETEEQIHIRESVARDIERHSLLSKNQDYWNTLVFLPFDELGSDDENQLKLMFYPLAQGGTIHIGMTKGGFFEDELRELGDYAIAGVVRYDDLSDQSLFLEPGGTNINDIEFEIYKGEPDWSNEDNGAFLVIPA
ncbi:MAG: DUF4339 domain-containing protein [Ferrovum sp.]|nr:DUF4339 domain-containing protein [Ferrovum sp.]